MTENERKEAIRIIKSECYISDLLDLDRTRMVNTALDTAVKALESKDVLDKIRAEIEALSNANPSYWHTCELVDRDDVLEIIDKYRAESEYKEIKNEN